MKLAYPVVLDGDGGPAWGYRTVAAGLRGALEAAGVEWDGEAPVALHVTPPHLFAPLPGRRNVLLTMVEFDQVAPELCWAIAQADLVLVPSEHNRVALKHAGLRRPIRVVPLGLGAAHAAPVPPRPPGPFRFLWVGQAEVRKGWNLVNGAFAEAFRDPRWNVELVMKTIPTAGASRGFTGGSGRIRVIAEAYTDAQLAGLYRACHAFVFPTYGEGWGMPVLEAMAAECLVLAPMHTGLLEFFDDGVGWSLPWHRVRADYGGPVAAYQTDGGALVAALRWATAATAEAVARVTARARARALTFTWAASARELLTMLHAMG